MTGMRNEEGSALVFAAIMVTILMGLTVLLLQGAVGESMSLDGDFDASVSLSSAEGGLEMALKTLDTSNWNAFTATNYGVDAAWNAGSDDANANGWPDFGETNVTPVDLGTGDIITYYKVTTDAADPKIKYVTLRSMGGCQMHQAHASARIESVLETVVKVVKVITPVTGVVPGALSITVGLEEEGDYTGNPVANIFGTPSISGYDHDEAGADLGTGGGVTGLAITDGNANPAWGVVQKGSPGTIEGNGADEVIDGVTYSINNDAAWTGDKLYEIYKASVSNPDIHVGPGDELDTKTDIGTIDDYKVVHVDLGDVDGAGIDIKGNFQGYGMMVITLSGVRTQPVITIGGTMDWNGMILVVPAKGSTISASAFATGAGTPALLGAAAILMPEDVKITTSSVVELKGTADIFFSTATVGKAIDAAGLNNITITATRLFPYYRVK